MASLFSDHLKGVAALGCLAIALVGPAHAQSSIDELDQARALLANGNANQAYQNLLLREDQLAGDPEFDYLLGLAALESGRADAATFAFERALTVDPNFFGARVDMARAYFFLGNNDLARNEFMALKALNPPPAAERTIDSYLEAIAERTQTTRFSHFIETEIGYDTNANAATSQGTVFIPALNTNVALDSNSASNEDWFARGRVGSKVAHKWSDATSLRASFSVDYHDFLTTDGFETTNFVGDVGADVASGADLFSIGLSAQYVKLDWNEYQTVAGINAQWRRTWNKLTQTTVFAQHNRVRYQQPTDISNDSNLNLAGITLVRALDDQGRTLISIGGFGGIGAERNTRIDGSREIFGARIAAQHRFTSSISASVGAGWQISLYDRENTLFNVRRRDQQIDFNASVNWIPADKWTVRPRLSLRRNITDVTLSAYERAELGLTVRRDF